jgi:eukaryotic-like serine/threonine-protein kinase
MIGVLRSLLRMEDESATRPDPIVGGLVDERYQVLEAMASGSMGAVYKAERVPVGKLVAIKFLHATFANDEEFLSRFERETRVMSKLNHPNCVSVVDFGVWEGAPYLVMEYVSGTTLRALLDNGPLPVRRALTLVRQIAAGLAHAHAQGIVHRDVKPANIMISEEIGTGDHVRILDFGLARLRGAAGRDATQANVVVGTPNYMAPEQTVGGGLIDARTDIYAVGVVLFEMICGERPFRAEDTLALLGMHRAAPIPQLADRVSRDVVVPAGLQAIIDRAMAKDAGDRFPSAIELAEAVDEVAAVREPSDPISRRSGVARKPELAPTLDISDAELIAPPRSAQRHRTSVGSLVLLVFGLGGAAAAAWLVLRDDATSGVAANNRAGSSGAGEPAGPVLARAGSSGAGEPAGPVLARAGSSGAGEPAGPVLARPGSSGAGEPAGHGEPLHAPASPAGDAQVGDAAELAGSGAGAELDMDPTTADDPAPAASKPATGVADEAANAPTTVAEVGKRVPAAPVRATTLPAAIQLIKEGKRDLALASLHALWKKTPGSSYIPFLIGNLYYDQLWWSAALEHYTATIKKNAQYRANPTINRNVISMLGSNKTVRKAEAFLRYTVGKPALPYVKYAAQHDASGQVRRVSGWLTKNL